MYWIIESYDGSGQPPPIIPILATLLERVVTRNEAAMAAATSSPLMQRPWKLTVFHGLRAPSISIGKYLERIYRYANCSPCCFVAAYAYIDRLLHHQHQQQQQSETIILTSLNVHRILITSVMLAAKFMDDAYYNNAYYAKVGGVTTMEINRLELEYLFALRFRLQVTVNVFESYCGLLQREMLLLSGYHQIQKPLMNYWWSSSSYGKKSTLQEKSKNTEQQQQQQKQQRSRSMMILLQQ